MNLVKTGEKEMWKETTELNESSAGQDERGHFRQS